MQQHKRWFEKTCNGKGRVLVAPEGPKLTGFLVFFNNLLLFPLFSIVGNSRNKNVIPVLALERK